ncbi:hypothetical protein GALMADRAFT_1254082 [Galerina marginata CBS 339.88]|uniref:Uncharacterized protein n=1 Tax=Galerina marginata (strain CBS 339.88) TaxID=685588 RepID=A0A067T5S2_GALM3|nr:hypothetical protein GALMADRAFT_1254082 [Galerina marginata CBS 339.88]
MGTSRVSFRLLWYNKRSSHPGLRLRLTAVPSHKQRKYSDFEGKQRCRRSLALYVRAAFTLLLLVGLYPRLIVPVRWHNFRPAGGSIALLLPLSAILSHKHRKQCC